MQILRSLIRQKLRLITFLGMLHFLRCVLLQFMGNGTRAFAVPVQPENYLKAAEQTTEQNYNMIDGQINNTPTTAELEAKVKAGETISLVDLAEAVKADKERGKAAKTEKKPSIRAQLRADKEKTAQKKAAKSKNHELEV